MFYLFIGPTLDYHIRQASLTVWSLVSMIQGHSGRHKTSGKHPQCACSAMEFTLI